MASTRSARRFRIWMHSRNKMQPWLSNLQLPLRALKDQVETVLLSTRVFRLFKGEKTVSEMAVSRRLAGARYADKAVVTTKKHETRLAHEVGRTTKQHGEHVDHR